MPTALQRHSITETPEIAEAIDDTEAIWPGASRSDVLRHLIIRGAQAIRLDLESRQAAIREWSGFLPGVYPQDAAQSLKDEWPE